MGHGAAEGHNCVVGKVLNDGTDVEVVEEIVDG